MEIGILTYYGVHNHGALLQANALKTVLENMGHKVSFLSFERSYEYISEEQTKKYKIGLSSIPFYFNYAKEKGLGNITYNLKKRNTLNTFRKNSFNIGPRYNEFSGDLVLIGSDEVFSLEIGYNEMMYGHQLNSKRIASYAGSFGPTTIEDIENKGKASLISTGLEKFSAIGVRDKNSQTIVEQLSHKKAELVCDPVILYGYPEEQFLYKPNDKDYILVYAYDNRMNDPKEVSAIKAYAEKSGCKLYSVGFYHKWCDKNINASPIELLGWIRNAKFVLTDTFHGSVYSIICNTPMVVKLRGNANKIKFLLEEYGLSGRIISDFGEIEKVAEEKIDFSAVSSTVSEKREASLRFLTDCVEG